MQKIPSFVLLSLLPIASFAFADEVAPAVAAPPTTAQLPDITVTGRADSLVGSASSASQGVVGQNYLQSRPLLQPGELLETVPGLVITQHSGSGKANQYYLRGFDLDHGTDFATTIDGMPVNLPTHAHGQGYSDLNFIIPELVERVDFQKGPYFADTGDFSTAGSADMHLTSNLKQGFLSTEIGSWGRDREVFGNSFLLDDDTHGTLTVGAEHLHDNGPWVTPENYQKYNGMVRYSAGDADAGWSVTGMGYEGSWNATNQIPEQAVQEGLISRFGSLNPTDGGNSQRFSLQAEMHQQTDAMEFKANAYAFYYRMNLWNDFTFYLADPVNGDQFQQHDSRTVEGVNASQLWRTDNGDGLRTENVVGLQLRSDQIQVGLFNTVDRQITGTISDDRVWQTNGGLYFQNTCFFGDHFRTIAGLRGDLYNFDVRSDNPANSGNTTAGILSPKLGLVVGPWAQTEFYANAGMGYHSNDARSITGTEDPNTGAPVTPASALVRTYGGEIGARTTPVDGLQSTLSLWVLQEESELLFDGDSGTTSPTGAARRYGVEWSNFYAMNHWLTFDADASFSQAKYLEEQNDGITTGTVVPDAIRSVVTAGMSFKDFHGFFGGIHARYFGPRPLTDDGSVSSTASFMVNASAGYQFNAHWKLTAEVFNLLNRQDQDAAYYYTYQLKGQPAPANGVVFHPVEPISARLCLTAMF